MYYFVFLRSLSLLRITFFSCNKKKDNVLDEIDYFLKEWKLFLFYYFCSFGTIACCKEKVSQWDHQPLHKCNVMKAILFADEYMATAKKYILWNKI